MIRTRKQLLINSPIRHSSRSGRPGQGKIDDTDSVTHLKRGSVSDVLDPQTECGREIGEYSALGIRGR